MDWSEWSLLAIFLAVAVLSGAFCVWWTIEYCKHPSRSFVGYGAALGLFGVIVSLIGLVLMLGRWSAASTLVLVFIVVTNVLLQPLFLLLFVGSVYKLYMGLTGRFSYAFQVIPPDAMPPEDYVQLRRYGLMQAAVGLVFTVAMSGACLSPLL